MMKLKLTPLAGVVLALSAALTLGANAQTYQVANSTGGQQVAGAPIAEALGSVSWLANDARGRAFQAQQTASTAQWTADNAQGAANWAGQVASNAQGTAAWAVQIGQDAQGTATDAWNRANNAQGTADWAANGVNANYSYVVATAAANCAQVMGSPAWYGWCYQNALAQFPHP